MPCGQSAREKPLTLRERRLPNCDALRWGIFDTANQNKGRSENMEGNAASGKVDLNQVMEIVSNYARYNRIAAEELSRLIAEVYRALAGVGQPGDHCPKLVFHVAHFRGAPITLSALLL